MRRWCKKRLYPGWASLVIIQGVFSGIMLIAIGVVGDYVGRFYEETKNRPLYIVDHVENLPVIQHTERALILNRAVSSRDQHE